MTEETVAKNDDDASTTVSEEGGNVSEGDQEESAVD